MIAEVTDRVLDANRGVFMRRWAELEADTNRLIRAHGFDPKRVAAVGYDVIDAPLLKMQVILDDEHGEPLLNETGDDLVYEWRDTMLRTTLPTWWKPSA